MGAAWNLRDFPTPLRLLKADVVPLPGLASVEDALPKVVALHERVASQRPGNEAPGEPPPVAA